MLKKFIGGLVFGSGFALAFILVVEIYFRFFFGPIVSADFEVPQQDFTGVPAMGVDDYQYLGSTGAYSGSFPHDTKSIVEEGEGRIVGVALANGEPVEGLMLRLALNGKAHSQWVTTNRQGQYVIPVPHGEYRIDGYQLEPRSANKALPGLIDSPANVHATDRFIVAASNDGVGLTFSFVHPVAKTTRTRAFSEGEQVEITWEPYDGAATYSIQIYEKSGPHDYMSNEVLFPWRALPEVNEPRFDVLAQGGELKSGHYYQYEVRARSSDGRIISESARSMRSYDFRVE